MRRSNQMLVVIAALALLILSATPCAAGTITVTVSGNWTTTGTTPANTLEFFSISFVADQEPVAQNVTANTFNLPVTMTYVNASMQTLNGTAGYIGDAGSEPLFDFRLYGIDAPTDYLQVWAYLPSVGFSGSTSDPTLLEMNAPLEFLEAYYYASHTAGSHTAIYCDDCTYVAVAGDIGAGQVPEPASLGLMTLALVGLAGFKLRRRA